MGRLVQHPAGHEPCQGAARRPNAIMPDMTAHWVRFPPAGRAAGPVGQNKKEAAMAVVHYFGVLRPHPLGRCPDPGPQRCPAGKMVWVPLGRPLLADRVTGVGPGKERLGIAGDDAASPLTSSGEPAGNPRCPTRKCPNPIPGVAAWRCRPITRRIAQLDRCSIKQKRKNDQPWFRQATVPWKTTALLDQSIWGRIEYPPNPRDSTTAP